MRRGLGASAEDVLESVKACLSASDGAGQPTFEDVLAKLHEWATKL